MPQQSLFRIKSKRGFRPEVATKLMQDTLREELKILGDDVVAEYNKIVADWSGDSRPTFRRVVESGATRQSLKIVVEGTEAQKGRWAMLDSKGRNTNKLIVANIIEFQTIKSPQAKAGSYQTRKYMRFQEKYHPKTVPVAQYAASDGGTRSGKWIKKSIVRHSIVEPRYFTRTMLPSFKEAYQLAVKRGYSRAFRALVKKGRVVPRRKFVFFRR